MGIYLVFIFYMVPFTNKEMNELYNHPKVKAMVSHTREKDLVDLY